MKLKRTLAGLFAISLLTTSCDALLTPNDTLGGDGSTLGITPGPKGQLPQAIAERANEASADMGSGNAGGAATTVPPSNPASDQANLSQGEKNGRPFDEAEPQASATPMASATAEPTPAATPAASATPAPSATADPNATAEPTPTPEATTPPDEEARDFFYFSYDDSASTAGVELTKHALKNSNPFLPQASWARPYEFLNAENFAKQGQEELGLFKVSMGLWKYNLANEGNADLYDLGVHVSAPDLTKADRQNLNLTLLIDVSGSMNGPSDVIDENGRVPSLMEVAKTGLRALPDNLKAGDKINMVAFSREATTLLENHEFSGDKSKLLEVIESLEPQSGTNLNVGVQAAYQLANKYYSTDKTNRVVILTDAYANIGEVDSSVIAQSTQINNAEGIYFSGLGFGSGFNEAFLNDLTEKGRGGYFSIITKNDATRAFDERFMALVNVAAKDVQFRVDYPASMKHIGGAAEEVSQVQSDVQPTNFSYNTSQYFLEQFKATGETNLSSQKIKLTIYYQDPKTFSKKTEVIEKPISELLGVDNNNIKDAHLVNLLTQLIKKDKTPDQVNGEIKALLSTHGSPIQNEYQAMINTYFNLVGFQP